MFLELFFGMTQTTVSDYLHFCMVIIVRNLQKGDGAKIYSQTLKELLNINRV